MPDGADGLLADLLQRAAETRTAAADRSSAEDARARRLDRLRGLVAGFDPLSSPVPPRLVERVGCDGYTRERVELGVVAGLSFRAYVLVPDGPGRTFPGVIATHGHGYGSRQVSGMAADGSPASDLDSHQHFAVDLVRRGLLVIAPDMIGFGERRSATDRTFDSESTSSCYRLAMTLLMHDLTLAGLRCTELLGVLSYLGQRPDVDDRRIGIVGFSGGSQLSMITSALDERIAATVLIGFPNTFAASILSVHHCACNYLPGLLADAELPDLIALLAPRRLFLESGRNDPIFPVAGFHQAVDEISAVYRAVGVPDRLNTDLHPGRHEVSGRHSLDWLAATLMA